MNPYHTLMETFKKDGRPVFSPHPFLILHRLRENGLVFNEVLQTADDMARAALLTIDAGFDSTTLPIDMNVEAELLGGTILYHDEVEGNPVYPTMGARTVETAEDIAIPDNVAQAGRMPVILDAISRARDAARGRGAVGAFVPGPFTLAGQVLNPDKMFVMVLKKPDAFGAILDRFTELLGKVRDAYVSAGAQYVSVEEGGATSISPRAFEKVLLPRLSRLLADKKAPHLLSLAGKSDRFIDLLIACKPDALGVDQECDFAAVKDRIPEGMPLFRVCGSYDMMARGSAETVGETVRAYMAGGAFPLPPADIYPPALPENIAAFVETARKGV